MRWLVVLVMASACNDDAPVYNAPVHTTYSCDPVSTGSASPDDCVGGPAWSSDYMTDGSHHQDDPALRFPAGCRAFIPECSPYYMGQARELECSQSSSGGIWGELL